MALRVTRPAARRMRRYSPHTSIRSNTWQSKVQRAHQALAPPIPQVETAWSQLPTVKATSPFWQSAQHMSSHLQPTALKSRIPEAHPSNEAEEDAPEDLDKVDFDPFLFIKRLPRLSDVVPPFRQHLLPKQTRRCPQKTLVLDLDGKLSCSLVSRGL